MKYVVAALLVLLAVVPGGSALKASAASKSEASPASASTGAAPGTPGIAEGTARAPRINIRTGLDGFCPVALTNERRWEAGDPKYSAYFEGRRYLMTSFEAKLDFETLPARYAPVFSGDDPVEWIDRGRRVPGMRSHGVYFENRVYLFASEANLTCFSNDHQRYTGRVDRPKLAAER